MITLQPNCELEFWEFRRSHYMPKLVRGGAVARGEVGIGSRGEVGIEGGGEVRIGGGSEVGFGGGGEVVGEGGDCVVAMEEDVGA